MKNKKLMKILAGTTAFTLFLAGCKGSSSGSSEDEQNRAGPSRSGGGKIVDDFVCNGGHTGAIDGAKNQSSEFEQCIARLSVITHTRFEHSIGSGMLSIGEKRRESEMANAVSACADQFVPKNKRQKRDSPLKDEGANQQDEIEITTEDKKQITQNSQAQQCVVKKREKKSIAQLELGLWDDMDVRLANRRRKAYKESHKTIYINTDLKWYKKREIKKESYKQRLRSSIEEFAAKIASLIKNNPMWYFIASKSTNINGKYKDLLGLQELFREEEKTHRNMLESIQGYYPGIIEDVIAYIEKHQPLKTDKNNPETEWKETLGDIYMRKSLPLNYSMLEDSNSACQLESKYRALVCAVRMALVLPEVHQDFSNITEDLIKETKISKSLSKNTNYQEILLRIQKIAQLNAKGEKDDKLYEEMYSYLEKTCAKGNKLEELRAVELYKVIYTILGKFYESVAVIDAKKEYVLAGKCIITNQKYIKCEKVVDMSGGEEKELPNSAYVLEENKWHVSSDIKPHYHVYYVDNTANQLRMLCMPMCIGKDRKKHCLHTIDEIVRYIKSLYKIKLRLEHVHPFKVKKGTREWSYIKEKERGLTVKDLAEYEVVFYYIEENLAKTKFTFAEFRPLSAHENHSICVPLFLSPLMQSAVEFGPFAKTEEHTELDSVYFEKKVPDVYEYREEYTNNNYTDVQKYYKNLYILKDAVASMDCYIMDYKTTRKEDGTVEAVWYVRMPDSIDAYTHCVLDKDFVQEENLENFTDTLELREHNKNSDIQGFWLQNSNPKDSELADQEYTVCSWHVCSDPYNMPISRNDVGKIGLKIDKARKRYVEVEKKHKELEKDSETHSREIKLKKNSLAAIKYKQKIILEGLYRELHIKHSRTPDSKAEFLVFRNVNKSKSNLGAHNEILNALISCFKREKSKKQE
ncbi:hypothetical protein NEMIN01_0273 [Nematocida minor]|uniref:uncharacterized protein n=1 Tax=Nematocida minor TaxID=1912983 RepID=UPI00222012A2|nr:uncharacterized protein NEMIN01_0273 [Nematocida minor]KAI5189107.1 hypothetical protein NEMIN01_0273 [Nematocida minor]